MRTLSATLEAAQKERSTVPFVKVTVSTKIAGVENLQWTRLYTGGETGRSFHAAAMPGDGSLLRARIDSGGPALFYSRVVNPGPSSTNSAWEAKGAVNNRGVALAASGANVILAYVPTGSPALNVYESSDYGATFGSPVLLVSGLAITWMAATMKSNGDAVIFFTAGTQLYRIRRTSGAWGSAIAWTNSANTLTGVAAVHYGDNHLVVAGTDGNDNPRLWAAIFGDGSSQPLDTWSGLFDIERASSGSDISFRALHMARLDTHRLFFVEKYTGALAYERPQASWFPPTVSFAAAAWREPVPFDLEPESYGVAITGDSTYAWLTTPDGVWRAPFTSELDVSQDVLEVVTSDRRDRGQARVTLRNDDGRYNNLPSGAFAQIRPGAELAISPGYATSVGQEVSSAPRYWIDGWEYTSAGGRATLVVFASDAWSLLSRWRARRQHEWAAGSDTVSQILTFILGRAAIEKLSVGPSSIATSLRPAFTIHPGEDGLRVVQRLLAMLPDNIHVVGEVAILSEPLPTDASDYTFGADHAVLQGRYAFPALEVNRAQAFGDGRMAQDFDFADIAEQLDRLRQVHDLNLTDDTKALDRAVNTLRQEVLSQDLGELLVPPNCGQESQDVVAVTDPNAGLVGAKYRVVGLDLHYKREGRSIYEQRILLGKV